MNHATHWNEIRLLIEVGKKLKEQGTIEYNKWLQINAFKLFDALQEAIDELDSYIRMQQMEAGE